MTSQPTAGSRGANNAHSLACSTFARPQVKRATAPSSSAWRNELIKDDTTKVRAKVNEPSPPHHFLLQAQQAQHARARGTQAHAARTRRACVACSHAHAAHHLSSPLSPPLTRTCRRPLALARCRTGRRHRRLAPHTSSCSSAPSLLLLLSLPTRPRATCPGRRMLARAPRHRPAPPCASSLQPCADTPPGVGGAQLGPFFELTRARERFEWEHVQRLNGCF